MLISVLMTSDNYLFNKPDSKYALKCILIFYEAREKKENIKSKLISSSLLKSFKNNNPTHKNTSINTFISGKEI